ncbi:MAG: hypothetical protein EDM79_09970 [Chloroflexi bacterium]|nr:MAG: hypothetical protein EDM79_09970 [Chloroflexota bacterium]
MLQNISQKFHQWAKGGLVLGMLVVYGFFAGYMMPQMAAWMNSAAGQSVTPLDLMMYYTPQQAFEMMERYGEAGRSAYLTIELTADIIYPLSTVLFFSLFLSWLFQRGYKPGNAMQKFNIMPAGSWLFDLVENAAIIPMILMHPAQSATLAWIAMALGLVKWGFAFISLGLVLVGIVKAALNGFKLQS